LTLFLKDFFCKNIADKIADFGNQELVISSKQLCKIYENALAFYFEDLELQETNDPNIAQAVKDKSPTSLKKYFRPRRSPSHPREERSVDGGPQESGLLQGTTSVASSSGPNIGIVRLPAEGAPWRSLRSRARRGGTGASGANTGV
jgi:hypothetical protein